MVFKAIILLTCLVSAHAAIKIKCRTGGGVSVKSHDANANISDFEEGVTQCKLSGVKAVGAAAYKFSCGKKGETKENGCKTGNLGVTCYCTGDKCGHCNPTDEKDKSCMNSANTIGTQATIGFTDFLAFFSKIMA
jgi:hypothetical protein